MRADPSSLPRAIRRGSWTADRSDLLSAASRDADGQRRDAGRAGGRQDALQQAFDPRTPRKPVAKTNTMITMVTPRVGQTQLCQLGSRLMAAAMRNPAATKHKRPTVLGTASVAPPALSCR